MQISITYTGPLATSGSAPMKKAVEHSIREIVELGHERLEQMLVPRPTGVYLTVPPGRSKGHYRRSIHHQIGDNSAVIDDSNVVYGPWLEAGNGGRFKGYASFRKTYQWMESITPEVVQAWVGKAVKEMGG